MTLTCKNCDHLPVDHVLIGDWTGDRGKCNVSGCFCVHFTPTWVEAKFRGR